MREAVVVEKRYAEDAIKFLLENEMLDDERRISREDKKVEIPVKGNIALPFPHSLKEQEYILYRGQDVPFKEIKKKAERIIGGKAELLPKKWEKFGDVLVIKFPGGFERKEEVAKIYADVLKCRTVLEDVGGIMGVKRKPLVKHIYGDKNAETIHVENKIKFMFDASKIMFSSGNVDERIRMAHAGNEGEVVVDMFAGIGYFSIPIAVYSKTEVYACEINDVAYNYLKKNIKLNNVEKNVTALYGDCRDVAPRNAADRVIMGYFKSKNFLPYAMEVLRGGKGIIHYHTTCPKSSFPEEPFSDVKKAALDYGKSVEMVFHKKVKSYAPGIIHGVIDVKVF
ncbi:MAG: class I SAM-dependent methyltransferase family protein [Thermoplasmata archaeon]|nr:class I SAM-dependent methyltransferase family protein [Thermoplasmata archaeon]